jgi:hypothetical protein
MLLKQPVLHNIRCRDSALNPKKASSKAIYRRVEQLYVKLPERILVILMDVKTNSDWFLMQY